MPVKEIFSSQVDPIDQLTGSRFIMLVSSQAFWLSYIERMRPLSIHFLWLCRDALHLQRTARREDFYPYVSESTDVSAVPAEVVDAKTSVEESPVAVQRTAQCSECGDAAFHRFGFLIEWMMSPSAGEACLVVKSER